MESFRKFLKQRIPAQVQNIIRPMYHFLFAFFAALYYGFPSRKLTVIGVTGTNGKTTVVEMLRRIFDAAGYRTASISSLRFHIGDREWKNEIKMSMPGRLMLQAFLKQARDAGATHIVIEVTSEGIRQFRDRFIDFDTAVLTNITPEHIESHGSFEKYRATKGKFLKRARVRVLNADDPAYGLFSNLSRGLTIGYRGHEEGIVASLQLLGEFNQRNARAALAVARYYGIPDEISVPALQEIAMVPGRLELVAPMPRIYVDYAHTPDALEQVYRVFSTDRLGGAKVHCILGSAGGGRDKWKRPELGRIAGNFCDTITVTNEDPYDEDPIAICKDVARGISHSSTPEIILDRREAIEHVVTQAKENDIIIITGKGAEPWMMIEKGRRIPWDDREVARAAFAKRTNS